MEPRWLVPPPAPEPETESPPRSRAGSAIQIPDHTRKVSPRGFSGALATGFGVGFAPVAPGTFGSALGVLLFIPLLWLPYGVYLATLIVVTGAGTWAAHRTQEATGIHDDGRIVVDEVAGQLLTLAPLLLLQEFSGFALFSLLMTGFVLFRVLDIWKPGPVGWAERSLAGGIGVMADDLVAGALGALVLGGGLAAAAELGWTTALRLSPLVGGALLA